MDSLFCFVLSPYLAWSVVVGQGLALVLSSQGVEECNDKILLIVCQLYARLIGTHSAYSLLERGASAIVVVWPGECHISQTWYLEAVTVTLYARLLEATIVLLGEFEATICEVVLAQAHQLVALAAEVFAYVASCTVVLLEELVALQLLGCDSLLVAS